MKEAYLYEKLKDNMVRCYLCNHRCLIKEGERGLCGVRENTGGILSSLVYGRVIARNVDPIEKKPLFHFLPGSRSYSIATVGCNFKCVFCQNSEISQMPTERREILGERMNPEEIVNDALKTHSSTISYTYTEPTIFYELAFDTARTAVSEGLRNIFVTNGYMTEECLKDIFPNLHGANIDLKSFDDGFYKKQCSARLKPVLKSIETMKKMDIWVEVTTLLIPGLNDSEEELKSIARFLVDLDPYIPWHISRFHPTYHLLDSDPTPVASIHKAKEIGTGLGLKYVYTGNIPGDEGEKTLCHNCGTLLIDRYGFSVRINRVMDNKCPDCGTVIPGVWD
ncbi:MAG: AmmeMemoRadiSam system radical SAM enzyme [Deltaproteobacteria bacterium]|nr:AmmeMemoRadiSam system radical SAM enzyme [Deltaproteobacteria bacterium]